MFKQLIALSAALVCAALLSACGGGGSGGDAPATSTNSFALKAAYSALVTTGVSANFTVSGTCTGSATLTTAAAAGTTFEGKAALRATETLTTSLSNCTPASSAQTSSTYYDSAFVPLGTVSTGVEYGVFLTAPAALPVTVKVGDTLAVGTITLYASSAKTAVTGTRVLSFVVESDTASTAVVNLISRSYNASNVLTATQQTRYRIDGIGVLTLVSIDAQVNAGSSNHLVFTRS